MRLMINHQTYYQYQYPVTRSMQYIRMVPQSSNRQQVLNWDVSVLGDRIEQPDGFGNTWIASTQRFSHQQLLIMAQGIVELDTNAPVTLDDRVPVGVYLQTTEHTLCQPEMVDFVKRYLTRGQTQNLQRLAEALLEHMPYTPGETHVETTAAEAFAQRRGVCQDHAQVFAAMTRYMGLPTRYVSGYLHVPAGDHLASHAWAEVYIDGGWHCYDVSNQLFIPGSHVQLAVGRDYADVAPVRGVRVDGGSESLRTVVQVLTC